MRRVSRLQQCVLDERRRRLRSGRHAELRLRHEIDGESRFAKQRGQLCRLASIGGC